MMSSSIRRYTDSFDYIYEMQILRNDYQNIHAVFKAVEVSLSELTDNQKNMIATYIQRMDVGVIDQLKTNPALLQLIQTTVQAVGPHLCSNITIVAKDETQKINAHKVLLAVKSDYFLEMFLADFKEKNLSEILLENIPSEVLKKIIDYTYTEQIDFDENIFFYADRFLFTQLKKKIEDYLISAVINQEIENQDLIHLWDFAIKSSSPRLLNVLIYKEFKKSEEERGELWKKIYSYLIEKKFLSSLDRLKALITTLDFLQLENFFLDSLRSNDSFTALFELTENQKAEIAYKIREMNLDVVDHLKKNVVLFKAIQNTIRVVDAKFCSNVTLEIKEGQTIHGVLAHKVFLTAQSEYFQRMFLGFFKEQNLPKITLESISLNTLTTLVNYTYTREVNFDSNLGELLFHADWFQFVELKKQVENHLIQSVQDGWIQGQDLINLWGVSTLANSSRLLSVITYCEIKKKLHEINQELWGEISTYYSERKLPINLDQLRHLIPSTSGLKLEGQSLVLGLKAHDTLTSLMLLFHVDEIELINISIPDLTRLLQQDPKYRLLPLRLNLSKCSISDENAVALAKIIQDTNITQIDLSENQIGDKGAQAFAEVLQQNSNLKELFLWLNQIGDLGAHAFAQALLQNRNLQSLELGENRIGNSGAQALAQALQTNSTLKELYLYDNQIGSTVKQDLRYKDWSKPKRLYTT